MRFLILLICLIFISSCASNEIKPDAKKPNKFLSKQEVYELYKKSFQNDGSIQYTPEVVDRMENLIPDDEFIDEHLKIMPEDEFKSNIKDDEILDVDLREFDSTTIYRQLNGRCTSYSLCAVIENIAKSLYDIDLKLSPAYAWHKDKNYSCKTKVDMALRTYLLEEKYWKHDKKTAEVFDFEKRGVVKVEHGFYLKDNLESVKKALNNDQAVYVGMKTPVSMLSCAKVVSPNSAPANGGHALSVVGLYQFPEDDILILKNSWGERCGDHGYQYLPVSLCKKNGFYCLFWTFDKLKFK